VESDDKFLGGVTGAAPSFAVKIDQGPKSLGFSANDGDHQGSPSVPARTNDSEFRDTDPNGQRILERTGIDRLSRKRSAVPARPVNMSVLTDLKKKFQLL